MTVDLRQDLNVGDYFGALTVWCIFFLIMFLISATCINWFCIGKSDDITVFEEYGYTHKINMRLGPHRPSFVAKQVRTPKSHIHD